MLSHNMTTSLTAQQVDVVLQLVNKAMMQNGRLPDSFDVKHSNQLVLTEISLKLQRQRSVLEDAKVI